MRFGHRATGRHGGKYSGGRIDGSVRRQFFDFLGAVLFS